MFSKLAVVSSLALLAVATPTPGGGGSPPPPPSNQCTTGSIQCCNSVQSATSGGLAGILGLLGIIVQDVTGLVGVGCSPLSVVGLNSNSCTQQPTCCTGNSFTGGIVLGCSPINIGL